MLTVFTVSRHLPRRFWTNRLLALCQSLAVLVPGLVAGGMECRAQQYVISTIAGGLPPATPVAALKAYIGYPKPQGVSEISASKRTGEG